MTRVARRTSQLFNLVIILVAMNRNGERFIYTFFVLSGLTSLVYQVVWFRMLALVFGNTVLAGSTVISVFFFGLALGSIFFGKLADRFHRRILLYGILEGAIGVYAILFPVFLDALDGAYISLYRSLGEGMQLNLIRAGISAVLLLPPTILMGGTFPLIARHAIEQMREFSRRISFLYFVNTAGAVSGTVLAGFLLIATFGIRITTFLTASLNVLIFAGSFFVQKLYPESSGTAEQQQAPEPAPTGPAQPIPFILWGTLVSGMTSIAYEVVWMRAFTSYFGSSVYSFSTILAAFLVGIALGSLYYSRKYGADYSALRAFGEIQLRIALSVILFLVLFMKLPAFIVWGIRASSESFPQYQLMQFLLVLLAMLYTTINLGASFPAANAAYVNSLEGMGRKIGRVYAYNTIGAILGAFISGFFLIPGIGMEKTIWGAFFLNLLLGIIALKKEGALDRMAWIWTGASLLLFVLAPRWDQNVLNYGIYASAYVLAGKSADPFFQMPETLGTRILKASGYQPPADSDEEPPQSTSADAKILYFKEGITSTISVIQDSQGFKNLLINGKADASNNRTGDMRTQLLLGHLPVLLSRKMPSSALVIGLGSGTTLGSVQRYPVKKIDCVEIEPAVVEAARLHFSDVNHNALDDPRVRLIIADGRNYLAAAQDRWDMITSEPSNLWMAGCSNLFTREFFQAANDRLNAGGIMCQWIHLYQISPNDIRVFLRTFGSVFPHVSIWIDDPDMLALGSMEPIQIDPQLLARRLASSVVTQELRPSNLSRLDQFLPILTTDTVMAARYSQGAPINRDDHPILEFSAPKSILEIHSQEIIRDLILGVPYQPTKP